MQIQIIDDSKQIGEFMEIIKSAWQSESAISGFKDTIHSMAYHGGIVLAAFDNGKMIGFSFSYPGYRHGHTYLYSHMTGVIDNKKYSGAGYELKMMQRKLAIEYGYDLIAWTFDPIMSLNGYFNTGKLGAVSRTYIDNFYGTMDDGINRGLPTDRLVAEWYINDDIDRSYDNPFFINEIHGYSMDFRDISGEKFIGIRLIKGFYDLKKANLEKAVDIKKDLRIIFHKLFNEGYTLINFDKNENSYILEKDFKIKSENIFY